MSNKKKYDQPFIFDMINFKILRVPSSATVCMGIGALKPNQNKITQ